MPTDRRRDGETGNGSDGWLSTGASIVSSTIIPSAKPPVKHMPDRTDARATALRVRLGGEAAQPADDRAGAVERERRELLGHARLGQRARSCSRRSTARPGVPNSDGMRTLNPASTTRCANSTTCGCSPGISWITITAGPVPPAYTGRVRPSCVNVDSREAGKLDATV